MWKGRTVPKGIKAKSLVLTLLRIGCLKSTCAALWRKTLKVERCSETGIAHQSISVTSNQGSLGFGIVVNCYQHQGPKKEIFNGEMRGKF